MTAGPVDTSKSPYARWRALPAGGVSLGQGFWARRQAVNRGASLDHGYRQLEASGNFNNLRLAAGRGEGEFRGMRFADSDVYKWLEAVAYDLAARPDAKLLGWAEEAIDLLAAAQSDDGYLNSYWQVVEPDRRWQDLGRGHEMYCAGHLMQAAVAYHRATGRGKLLDIARRFADHIDSVFGPTGRPGIPGHPEIETALVELYRHTGEGRYLDLARLLLDRRGRETLNLGQLGPDYFQDHVPVREADTMAGHAVRQLYLAAGAADVYLETGDPAIYEAMMRQWRDMTEHHLFVTGGLGSQHRGEAFGRPYELPNESCYCETCAQIASIMWCWRMLLATGESSFADVIELTMYNGFLSGVALDGRSYFYVNPLQSRGAAQSSGRSLPERQEWFACACCPPNVMRLISSLAHYVATRDAGGVQIHQYAGADIGFETGGGGRALLRMETDYPWRGLVRFAVEETGGEAWSLSLRVPGWSEGASLRVNGRPWDAAVSPGAYITVERTWREGDSVELDLSMAPFLLRGHPRIESVRGCAAIRRGPLVYCLEQADQPAGTDLFDMELEPSVPLRSSWRPDLLDGVMAVHASGHVVDSAPWEGRLYRRVEPANGEPRRSVDLTAVPYYAWANRGPNAMRVWLPIADRC